jgi:hypothetical protein
MLATGRRAHAATELEKTYPLGRSLPSNPNGSTSWKSYKVTPKTQQDNDILQGLVKTYIESTIELEALEKSKAEDRIKLAELQKQKETLQKQKETLLSEKAAAVQVEIDSKRRVLEAKRTALAKTLAKIFKSTEENIISMFGPEKLDRLEIEARKIIIDPEGMDAVIVAYLTTHSLPALDLRSFNFQGEALNHLCQALPKTDVRSICLNPQQLSEKETIEKALSGLGRNLKIVIKK